MNVRISVLAFLILGAMLVPGCPGAAVKPVAPKPLSPATSPAEPAAAMKVTGIAVVSTLDELRKLPVPAKADDWDLRIALADSGIENAPWKLLYVLGSYRGPDETPSDPEFGVGRGFMMGKIGFDLDYAKPGMIFKDTFRMIDRVEELSRLSKTTQRLYCATVPMPSIGRYRLQIGPQRNGIEAIVELKLAPEICWRPLLKRLPYKEVAKDTQDPEPRVIPEPVYELSPDDFAVAPNLPESEVWYAMPHQNDGPNATLYSAGLPGSLPSFKGWEQWPGPQNMRVVMAPREILRTRQLELSLQDGQSLQIHGLQSKRGLEESLIARWWVNGKLATAREKEELVKSSSAEIEKAERVETAPEGGFEVDVPLVLPRWLSQQVKPGDKVRLQIFASPSRWTYLSTERRRRSLQKNGRSSLPMAVSNRLEFVVTEEMLPPPKAATQPGVPQP